MRVMMLDVGGGTDVKIVEGEACLLLLLFLPRLEPGNVSAHLITTLSHICRNQLSNTEWAKRKFIRQLICQLMVHNHHQWWMMYRYVRPVRKICYGLHKALLTQMEWGSELHLGLKATDVWFRLESGTFHLIWSQLVVHRSSESMRAEAAETKPFFQFQLGCLILRDKYHLQEIGNVSPPTKSWQLGSYFTIFDWPGNPIKVWKYNKCPSVWGGN